ncbi:glycosyltransferase family 4 protein [Aurantibacillus circumpalustris]|uniref:glycosyltransferase family 4 protein n=1 Tax=Aurantibacillus circumpalustris TaxID=3036359 RepID=UPI00295A5F17|nr:glycosyltransferase [Aurantibacillus circumpalustris]
MSKPKICVLIDWFLPGTKAGGPVRSVYSLVSLLKKYFDFYIITTNCDLGETSEYEQIESNKLFIKDEVHYYYFGKEKLNSNNLLSLLKEIDPKIIYLNSFWSVNFSINIVRFKKSNEISSTIVLAPRGMLGKGALGLKSFKKSVYLWLTRISGLYSDILFHATQKQEKEDILKKFPNAKTCIAPNVNSGSVILNKSSKNINNLKLFYLSRIAKVKNLHFALEVLKDIPEKYTIEYSIYGNLEDSEYWNYCKEMIGNLPPNVSVTYQRELQFNEVQKIIRDYNCLFLPTLNENFGHSIVESLLCGCPVIISDQTPWNDLEENNAGYAISLDNKQKFIDCIVNCAILNQEEFTKKSREAINYISKKIDLELIVKQYKTLFNEQTKN